MDKYSTAEIKNLLKKMANDDKKEKKGYAKNLYTSICSFAFMTALLGALILANVLIWGSIFK